MLRALVIAWALLLGFVPAQAKPGGGPDLVDLTGDFDALWQESRDMAGPARAAAFRARMAPLLPGFYDPARRGATPVRYDALLASAFAAYPQQRAGILEVSRRFAGLFAPARRSFEAIFGPVPAQRPIYLLHSLGEMDGGTRSLPGGNVLIFGADVIARLHLAHDIRPFFHHELFHLYHFARFRECPQLWCTLWTEGLATYVARRLTPRATDAELLFEVPEPIRPAVEANRTEAVCTVLARLDSTDDADAGALFSFRRFNPRLPPRFGYYVGYLVAARLGRGRPLPELARLPPDRLRPLVERALRNMASCGQAPPRSGT